MQGIKLIIWDMDGVKYVITDEFQSLYTEAVAQAASKLVSGLEFGHAHHLAKESKNQHGKSMRVFVDNYGLDYLTLGMNAESALDLSILPARPGFNTKLKETEVDHLILTEGNPVWTKRILRQIELHDFYADRLVITKADYPGNTKRDRYPFELALAKSGHKAENALIPEDTEDNLLHPYDMGMKTVLIHASPHKQRKRHVDYIFPDAEAFLDYFKHERSKHLKL